MDIAKNIKKHFCFLKDYGYKSKIFSKNGDYEFVYSKNNVVVEINYSLSIQNDYFVKKETSIDELMENSFYSIFIIITAKGERKELFQCSLFSVDKLSVLEKSIRTCKTGEEKLLVYAQFIQGNILELV